MFCFWKCCTSIKALFFLLTKFRNTKLRTVPHGTSMIHLPKFHNTKLRTVSHGTVRKVRLIRIFITRTNVPYPYLSNNYVPFKRTVLIAEKWSVPYRIVLPSLTAGSTICQLNTSGSKIPRLSPYKGAFLLRHFAHTKGKNLINRVKQ